jgi:hypothetical protein
VHLLLNLPYLLLRYIDVDAHLLEPHIDRVVPFQSLGRRGLSGLDRSTQLLGQLVREGVGVVVPSSAWRRDNEQGAARR